MQGAKSDGVAIGHAPEAAPGAVPSKSHSGGTVDLSISIVSHGHGPLIERLLQSLEEHRPSARLEAIVTLNVPEVFDAERLGLSFSVRIVQNAHPRGFAYNHNQAFQLATGSHFCVLNPDILFREEVFSSLLAELESPDMGIVAPGVVEADGMAGDNYRKLPTPQRMLARALQRGRPLDLVRVDERGYALPDWIAGMFLLMRADLFRELNGFDERYFLYLEDVDLGVRCQLAGYSMVVNTRVKVIHQARRDSRKKLRFLLWHLTSTAKFFTSAPFWSAVMRGWRQRE